MSHTPALVQAAWLLRKRPELDDRHVAKKSGLPLARVRELRAELAQGLGPQSSLGIPVQKVKRRRTKGQP